MLQAPVRDGLLFDVLPFPQNDVATPEGDIGECEIAQALVGVVPLAVKFGEASCAG